jgi:hypothetical protein
MLEFIRGLHVVKPILMEYPSIAEREVDHADIIHSVFWTAQPRGNRFALTEDTSRCIAKLVFATELLDLTNQVTPWSTVLEKLTVPQIVKKFPAFYGTRRFITAFTNSPTCPYPEPDQSSPCPHITLPEDPT